MLRIVVCAMALLLTVDSNAIGKRSLDKFVKEKKELKDTLAQLGKVNPSDITKANILTDKANKLIASVIKIDRTVAEEFQGELDRYVLDAVVRLKGEAKAAVKEAKETEEKESVAIGKEENKITTSVDKVLQAEGETVPQEAKQAIAQAATSGKLSYWAWVKRPFSWAASPFTALINKSWQLTMSIFNNFIKTAGSFGIFKGKALAIIDAERKALHTNIILTSLAGAKKVNAVLERLTNNDLTNLAPKERGWLLGKVFKNNLNAVRDKNSFRNTEVYTWLVHEFLEAGAILSQDIDLSQYEDGKALAQEVKTMIQLWDELSEKKSFSDNESVQCLWYEIGNVLGSAAVKQLQLISQAEKDANAGNYPIGRPNELLLQFGYLTDIVYSDKQGNITFTNMSKNFNVMKNIDNRSFDEHMKLSYSQRLAKLTPSGETVAAIAGLALVFMGSSKLVEDYYPQYKTTISAYGAVPINMAITALKSSGDVLKNFATHVSSKIRQFPVGEQVLDKVSLAWTKASGLVTAGVSLVGAGMLKAKNKIMSAQEILYDDKGEAEENFRVHEAAYPKEPKNVFAEQEKRHDQVWEDYGNDLYNYNQVPYGSPFLAFDPFAPQPDQQPVQQPINEPSMKIDAY